MTDFRPSAPRPLPSRYKYGFWAGGLALAGLLLLLVASRSGGSLATLSPLEPETPPFLVTSGSFSRGSTLYDILRSASLAPPKIQEIGDALKRLVDPRSLKASDRYEVAHSTAGDFYRLTITRGLRKYTVSALPGAAAALSVLAEDVPLTVEERSLSGRLKSSLWESLSAQEADAELIMGFADIFAWNIDFLTELREGDRYAVLWERKSTPSGEVAERKILAALYDGKYTGRKTAVLFGGEYYDPDGSSVRKAFLHAPLNFRRISSGFTHRRFHPILRYFRPHLGIDYAAPQGTPVVSVGNGTVIFKGRKGMYGNLVQVRHNGTYTTYYAHLSRFAKNIRRGSHVSQGQVIGYVGQTGHATGPHLDFRVVKNGKFVNFLKLKFPADKHVPAAQRPEFNALAQERQEQLEDLLNQAAPLQG